MTTLFTSTVPSHHRFVSPSQHPKQSLPSQSLSVALQGNLEPAVAVTLQEQKMTDWMASPVTRRFGIGAGLTWSGFLAFGAVSEQMKKSPLDVFQEEDTTRVKQQEEIILPNGIRYYDLQAGSGATPSSGYLVVFDVKGKVHGTEQVFVDTFGSKDKKKSLAMVMDSRPYSKGLCEGIEYVLRSMKAGGKRRVIIPPTLGFGSKNVEFGPGLQIPPSATLDYIIEVDTVYCFQTIV
ncbi:PREDICTED: peptidyl-prolyl cis-trans isomerase FKBP17-3, chloroplastic-like [Camelina sativa]|uniref:peptidylprolyl isomerase n=1 Tax=Camelina sativa TaxID=90675 RepID=A0ABM0SU53_CAMSA|nr:PREDICTED: peptidyl-prolyl cis-trans isomerase FKBP17-3, chloroplastic-like [Camelina sativa]